MEWGELRTWQSGMGKIKGRSEGFGDAAWVGFGYEAVVEGAG